MGDFINQIGIDWHLLVSQAVNFALLLVVLRMFVYKPLLKMMKDRRARIEEGLEKAKEADQRLREIDEVHKERIREADKQALEIVRRSEAEGKNLEAKMLAEAEKKEAELFAAAQIAADRKKQEAEESLRKEAAALVKSALVKTVELDPRAIDDTLIDRATKEVMQKA